MEDTSSRLTYHPVTMTINGVTKSVLVPLPKAHSQYRPVTAKLPDGSAIIITPSSSMAPVGDHSDAVSTTAPSHATASELLLKSRQHQATVLTPSTSSSAGRRSIVTVKPIINSQRLFGGDGSVVIAARPRLSSPSAVSVQSPSGERRIVHITPPTTSAASVARCIRLPVSLVRPTLLNAATASLTSNSVSRPRLQVSSSAITRPIILRKSQSTVSRSACTAVVRPRTQSSVFPVAKVLSLVSLPRTLSRREAIAAGWCDADDDHDQVQPAADDSAGPGAVDQLPCVVGPIRHIVPMDTDGEHSADVSDNELKALCSDSAVDQPRDATDVDPPPPGDDDRIIVVDNETQMKVIEIFPDDAADVASNHDVEDDVKPAVQIKDEAVTNAAVEDFSRQCSSVSTDTAFSDVEQSLSTSNNFVVLAEWSQDDTPALSSATGTPDKPAARHRRRRKRKSKKYSWNKHRKSPSTAVYKARRTGGRPMTAVERYGIVDCFVSLPVFRLPKPSVDVRNWWRHVCCRTNQIQRCRCSSLSSGSQRHASTTGTEHDDGSKIRQLVETAGLIQPSLLATGSATLPVQLSGPTSVDGVTPLVVRQPDGKLANVVAKRTSPGGTVLDANKKKYLLIKTKSGSFLVPVNNLKGASAGAVPTTEAPPTPSPSPTSSMKVERTVVSDTSGHRERIRQLKERLRQEEEQLQSIRSQLSCSAGQKFGLDSTRY